MAVDNLFYYGLKIDVENNSLWIYIDNSSVEMVFLDPLKTSPKIVKSEKGYDLKYFNIYKGIDIFYEFRESSIKEIIVIKNKRSAKDFNIKFNLHECLLVHNSEEKAYKFLDKNDNELFGFEYSHPIIENHNKEYNLEPYFSMLYDEGSNQLKYNIKKTIPKDAFPVKIDPSFNFNTFLKRNLSSYQSEISQHNYLYITGQTYDGTTGRFVSDATYNKTEDTFQSDDVVFEKNIRLIFPYNYTNMDQATVLIKQGSREVASTPYALQQNTDDLGGRTYKYIDITLSENRPSKILLQCDAHFSIGTYGDFWTAYKRTFTLLPSMDISFNSDDAIQTKITDGTSEFYTISKLFVSNINSFSPLEYHIIPYRLVPSDSEDLAKTTTFKLTPTNVESKSSFYLNASFDLNMGTFPNPKNSDSNSFTNMIYVIPKSAINSRTSIEEDVAFTKYYKYIDPSDFVFGLSTNYGIVEQNRVSILNTPFYVSLKQKSQYYYSAGTNKTIKDNFSKNISRNLDVDLITNEEEGVIGIPLSNSPFISGDEITISGTDNYDGSYTVLSTSTSSSVHVYHEFSKSTIITPGDNSFKFAFCADQRQYTGSGSYDTTSYFRGVCEAISQIDNVELLVVGGDLDPPANTQYTIETYLGSDFPWYAVVGNHETEDVDGSDMTWMRNFNTGGYTLPNIVNCGPSNCVETTYSFDYEDCHFIILNVYYDGTSDVGKYPPTGGGNSGGDIDDDLYNWLKKDIEETTKRHIFVFGHAPAFVMPDQDNYNMRHENDCLNFYESNRDRFWELLKSRGVKIYFCGHSHRYSHTNIDGVWQIDAGHARGEGDTGAQSTFVIVEVDNGTVNFKTYRNNIITPNYSNYTLDHKGKLIGPDCKVRTLRYGQFPDSNYVGSYDSYINAGSATVNYGTSSSVSVDGYPDDKFALLKWDISDISSNSTVLSVSSMIDISNSSAEVYESYEVKRDWKESEVTWNEFASGSSWGTAGANSADDKGSDIILRFQPKATIFGKSCSSFTKGGVSLVQSWIDESSLNNGIIIQSGSLSDAFVFSSKESTTIGDRPELTIFYEKKDTSLDITDEGSGVIGIPYPNHKFNSGDYIIVNGTINYDGFYTVLSTSTSDFVHIEASYIAETLTGTETISFAYVSETLHGDETIIINPSYSNITAGAAVKIESGVVGIPANNHGLSFINKILIKGTNNYNGFYNVLNSSTANFIYITSDYEEETFDGTETYQEIIEIHIEEMIEDDLTEPHTTIMFNTAPFIIQFTAKKFPVTLSFGGTGNWKYGNIPQNCFYDSWLVGESLNKILSFYVIRNTPSSIVLRGKVKSQIENMNKFGLFLFLPDKISFSFSGSGYVEQSLRLEKSYISSDDECLYYNNLPISMISGKDTSIDFTITDTNKKFAGISGILSFDNRSSFSYNDGVSSDDLSISSFINLNGSDITDSNPKKFYLKTGGSQFHRSLVPYNLQDNVLILIVNTTASFDNFVIDVHKTDGTIENIGSDVSGKIKIRQLNSAKTKYEILIDQSQYNYNYIGFTYTLESSSG